jgi:hypothetical protein
MKHSSEKEISNKAENKYRGPTFDSWLKEEGIYEEVTAAAVIEVFAEKAWAEMKRKHRSQAWLAHKMDTSRSVLNRLFRPKPASVNVSTLVKLADALDKDIRIELVDRKPRCAKGWDIDKSISSRTGIKV